MLYRLPEDHSRHSVSEKTPSRPSAATCDSWGRHGGSACRKTIKRQQDAWVVLQWRRQCPEYMRLVAKKNQCCWAASAERQHAAPVLGVPCSGSVLVTSVMSDVSLLAFTLLLTCSRAHQLRSFITLNSCCRKPLIAQSWLDKLSL